jgi:hypothetical protein
MDENYEVVDLPEDTNVISEEDEDAFPYKALFAAFVAGVTTTATFVGVRKLKNRKKNQTPAEVIVVAPVVETPIVPPTA